MKSIQCTYGNTKQVTYRMVRGALADIGQEDLEVWNSKPSDTSVIYTYQEFLARRGILFHDIRQMLEYVHR